jgi:hypothetical protein
MINGSQEQLFLAGEVPVNGPLADARFVGDLLDIRRPEPAFREHGRGGVEDFRTPALLKLAIWRTPYRAVTFCGDLHGQESPEALFY